MKLKNSFHCSINVEPEIMGIFIHKLLLQPFVENAILHGFEGVDRTHSLYMDMKREQDFIKIEIKDNGCGIPSEIVQEMNAGVFGRRMTGIISEWKMPLREFGCIMGKGRKLW